MNTFKKDLLSFYKQAGASIGLPPPPGSGLGMPNPANILGQLCTNEAKKECPRGVGKGGGLMGSINYESYTFKDGWVVLVGTNQKYAKGVEEGQKPHYVSPKDLVLWCQRKLNLSRDEAERASYAVSKKIQKEGTKAQPFLVPGCITGHKVWVSRYGK